MIACLKTEAFCREPQFILSQITETVTSSLTGGRTITQPLLRLFSKSICCDRPRHTVFGQLFAVESIVIGNTPMYYERKLFALLHDPYLKALYRNKSSKGVWERVSCLKKHTQELQDWWNKHGGITADHIASASDRLSFQQEMRTPPIQTNNVTQVEITHPISGAKSCLNFSWAGSLSDENLTEIETDSFLKIPRKP